MRLVSLLACLLFSRVAAIAGGPAQQNGDFAGTWVLKLGPHVFLTATFSQLPEGSFTGSLRRPQHFSITDGESFSGIRGPVLEYPVVRSTAKNNCLAFTTENPNKSGDEDNFQLCTIGKDRGTLKIDMPELVSWPVVKEAGATVFADWDSAKIYFLDDSHVSSPEMDKIFTEDQRVREPGVGKIDWNVVNRSDADCRRATAQLLANGKLHTGEDFERAAFVFQHGDSPDDYLLAHTLAMVAVARGQSSAIWISAATLDRYLNSIHQPQIYGTQFLFPPNQPTTQEPYNRTLVPDALRRYLRVPLQSAQEEQRKQYEAQRKASSNGGNDR